MRSPSLTLEGISISDLRIWKVVWKPRDPPRETLGESDRQLATEL